jgi:membrane protein DedA with SNARE-associated domain
VAPPDRPHREEAPAAGPRSHKAGPPAAAPLDPAERIRRRRRLALLVTPIVVLSIAGILADWFAAAIITEHPLLQMFLNPRNRYLVLAANQVDPVPYYLVGFFRLVLTDPLFYLLGLLYGHAAVLWMERKLALGEGTLQTLERWFGKAAYVIVPIAPNGFICLLAGAAGMRPAVFVTLDVLGTIGRLILLDLFASALEAPLDDFLGFIRRYQWWIVGVSVAIGILQLWYRKRTGRSEIETVSEVERELEEAEAEVGAEHGAGPVGTKGSEGRPREDPGPQE